MSPYLSDLQRRKYRVDFIGKKLDWRICPSVGTVRNGTSKTVCPTKSSIKLFMYKGRGNQMTFDQFVYLLSKNRVRVIDRV